MPGAIATVPVSPADLLDRCADLKHDLVEFGCSKRFSKQLERTVTENPASLSGSELEFANLVDWFLLQQKMPDGRTVAEIFASEHPDLTQAEQEMVLGWRDVVEGVFEVREHHGDSLVAVNLIDELTYQVRSNAGRAALAAMPARSYLAARLVPLGDEWMLSGAQHLYAASDGAAVRQLAAELAAQCPRLVFRNPEKVSCGWELARAHRDRFVEFFGSDLVVVPGRDVPARMRAFNTWNTDRVLAEHEGVRADYDRVTALTPEMEIPEDLAASDSVALICDPAEGLVFLANFRLVQEAFEDPRLAADQAHRQAVLGYLRDDSVSTLPFRRLADRNPAAASRLLQRLLKKPSFSWEEHGEALLRKYKPRCFGRQRYPWITPISATLAAAVRTSS
jgi:hypothetical protein